MMVSRYLGAALILVFVALFVVTGDTIPRYSVRYEQDCHLCHMNPTGAGERTLYASQFIAPTELAITELDPETMERLSPSLSDAVTIGADLRTLFLRDTIEEDDRFQTRRPQFENFFEMQGNLYFHLQATDRLAIYYAQGINTTSEFFGIGHYLPANGYMKVGRFMPDFGWRFADHTHFTRDYLGFFPPQHTDVGMEAGTYPGPFSFSAGVYNGNLGGINEFDDRLAAAGRGAVRWSAGPLTGSLGGSVWRNWNTQGLDLPRLATGPFASLGIGRVTWLGEIDYAETVFTGQPLRRSWFAANELTVALARGVDLTGQFDYVDPDRDRPSDARYRVGGGIEVLPLPFLEFEGWFNRYQDERAAEPGYVPEEYSQILLQLHVLY